MEMENSSSRSPDSSCPDYYSYPASLQEQANSHTQSSGILDNRISSSTGSVSSSTFGNFQNRVLEINNGRSGQIAEDLSRGQDYQNNGRSVISFATIERNDADDIFRPTPKYSSRGRSYHNGGGNVSNFPAVGSYWSGSSVADKQGSLLPSADYQNSSSTSSGTSVNSISNITINQVHISQGSSAYAKPTVPYFDNAFNARSAPTTSAIFFPKTELSRVSSSISSDSSNLSIPSPNTNFLSSARQQKTNILDGQIISKTQMPVASSHNPSAKHRLCSYNLNAQQSESIKNSHEERGLKRKSSPVLNNSDYLSSAPSSSSHYVNREQNISINSKKSKVLGSSYLKLEEIDDDIQIIMPETSRNSRNGSNLLAKGHSSASSSSGASWSAANCHKPSVISDGSRLSSANSATQTFYELDQNQSSRQITQAVSVQSLSTEEDILEGILDSVWSDLDEIALASNVISPAVSTEETITISPVSENDDSSSSSIISVHEELLLEDNNSSDSNKASSPILKKVPSDVPSLITIDDSPKNGELLELKAKQEAENVKEDFKKLLEDELICNICTELLIKPITLGCSHTFCKFCISEWKEKKNQCPMCRAAIVTETPCLFLDNFISKAVEQLDPASVEKRLEIIKSREEQQKNKVNKPPVQLSHQIPLQTYPPYMTYQTFPRPNVHQPLNMVQRSLNLIQTSGRFQQSTPLINRPQPSSSVSHSPSMLQLPSNPHHVTVPMNGFFFF